MNNNGDNIIEELRKRVEVFYILSSVRCTEEKLKDKKRECFEWKK